MGGSATRGVQILLELCAERCPGMRKLQTWGMCLPPPKVLSGAHPVGIPGALCVPECAGGSLHLPSHLGDRVPIPSSVFIRTLVIGHFLGCRSMAH